MRASLRAARDRVSLGKGKASAEPMENGTGNHKMNHSSSSSKDSSNDEAEVLDQASFPTFLQARHEIESSLEPVFAKDPSMRAVFAAMCRPNYIHTFKVRWEDDSGRIRHQTGWRVQQSNALGPYKGGLRFDPSVNLDVLRFLALEQTLKNALTGAPMGSGKGGSDFNPKGKSPAEIRRFCDAFMAGLHRVVGPDMDVPAGDIGVGGTVIGYLYGAWLRLGHGHGGVLTGKPIEVGGSAGRTEATGFGLVYITEMLVKDKLNSQLKGMHVLVSGSGNVATYAAIKCIQLGAIVHSLSDRAGTYFAKDGLSEADVRAILESKSASGGKLPSGVEVIKGVRPWQANTSVKIDIALPCATQNEINEADAKALVARGVRVVAEGANLPSEDGAVAVYRKNKLLYVNAKLSNCGGVGTSFFEASSPVFAACRCQRGQALLLLLLLCPPAHPTPPPITHNENQKQMAQNASRSAWDVDRVDKELRDLMAQAYEQAKKAAEEYGVSLSDGANIAGFLRVAKAMQLLGEV